MEVCHFPQENTPIPLDIWLFSYMQNWSFLKEKGWNTVYTPLVKSAKMRKMRKYAALCLDFHLLRGKASSIIRAAATIGIILMHFNSSLGELAWELRYSTSTSSLGTISQSIQPVYFHQSDYRMLCNTSCRSIFSFTISNNVVILLSLIAQ